MKKEKKTLDFDYSQCKYTLFMDDFATDGLTIGLQKFSRG